jgi:riboflavin-specific deaminase-like protein
VHLKFAASLDGKIACANGASQWLSGPQSHGYAHYLRQQYDAVLVGRGTVEADNPRLTVRPDVLGNYMDMTGIRLRDPVRIVIDPDLRLRNRLPQYRLASGGSPRCGLPTLILVCSLEAKQRVAHSGGADVELVALARDKYGELDLNELPLQLLELGVTSVLVEGGRHVLSSFLKQNAADMLSIVFTPHMLGADALGFSPQLGLESVPAQAALERARARQLGCDVLVSGELRRT